LHLFHESVGDGLMNLSDCQTVGEISPLFCCLREETLLELLVGSIIAAYLLASHFKYYSYCLSIIATLHVLLS